MEFIDKLNVAATASPPLQVLNLAGSVIGMVPHHWAALTGNIITTGARIGTAAVSKGRTEMYMSDINKSLFNPRGLKAVIATTEAVMTRCGMPLDASLTDADSHYNFHERLLFALAPYTAPITLEVPPPMTQEFSLDRISAKQVVRSERNTQKKFDKKREKAQKKINRGNDEIQREIAKLDKEIDQLQARAEREVAKKPRDTEKIQNKLEREVQKTDRERFKLEEKLDHGSGGSDKEAKRMRKALWILIESLDQR